MQSELNQNKGTSLIITTNKLGGGMPQQLLALQEHDSGNATQVCRVSHAQVASYYIFLCNVPFLTQLGFF